MVTNSEGRITSADDRPDKPSHSRHATYRASPLSLRDRPYEIGLTSPTSPGRLMCSCQPAKLIFMDTIPVEGGAEAANVTVWTEVSLLEALVQERTIADYFMALLDELEPVQQAL